MSHQTLTSTEMLTCHDVPNMHSRMYGATTNVVSSVEEYTESVDVAGTYDACPLQQTPMATNDLRSHRRAFGYEHAELSTAFLGGLSSLDTTWQ
jgi:hypothetical protein